MPESTPSETDILIVIKREIVRQSKEPDIFIEYSEIELQYKFPAGTIQQNHIKTAIKDYKVTPVEIRESRAQLRNTSLGYFSKSIRGI